MGGYNLNEQPLAFDRVLPWEGQVPAFVRESGKAYLQIAAPEAKKVSFVIEETERPCEKDKNGQLQHQRRNPNQNAFQTPHH